MDNVPFHETLNELANTFNGHQIIEELELHGVSDGIVKHS